MSGMPWLRFCCKRLGWSRVTRCAFKYLTRDNSTFRKCSPLRIRSSFKRFLHCGSKVLGVVKSPKCFVLKWETWCRFSTCVVSSFFCTSIQTLRHFTTFRVPQCYLFRRRTFFAYFKSVIKISKGFKKWNCFRKINLKTSLIVSIVRTATSVTKIIFRKYKFLVLNRKMLVSLSHQFLFGQIQF